MGGSVIFAVACRFGKQQLAGLPVLTGRLAVASEYDSVDESVELPPRDG